MVEETNQVMGDRLKDIGMYNRIKLILIDFLRGYPAYKYYGIFETYFKPEIVSEILEQLKQDEIIKLWKLNIEGKEVLGYSLTGKGAQLASSFRTKRRIDIGIILVAMSVVIGLAHYLLAYAQFPLF